MTNRTKIIGLGLMAFGILVWLYYTYNLLVNGGVFENFLGIPLLDAYWIIALPMFVLMTGVIALMIWLGMSTFTTPEPRVTDEELRKLEELERLARAKRMARQKKKEETS